MLHSASCLTILVAVMKASWPVECTCDLAVDSKFLGALSRRAGVQTARQAAEAAAAAIREAEDAAEHATRVEEEAVGHGRASHLSSPSHPLPAQPPDEPFPGVILGWIGPHAGTDLVPIS